MDAKVSHAEAVPTQAEQQLSPWEAQGQVWPEAAGRFSHLWVRPHPCALHVVSPRRRQKSQKLVVHVRLGSKSWCFQELLICCLFVDISFSISRGASEVWAVPVQLVPPWGQLGGAAAAAVSPRCCSGSAPATFRQSWCFPELAWSSSGSLSGRIASITKQTLLFFLL